MDSFQGRHFPGGGGGGGGDLQQPQQNPFPNPYHLQPQPHPSPASNYSYPPPPPPPPHLHHHYPSPPAISSQHQPPPPQQQQWGHPDGHLQQQQQHPLPLPYLQTVVSPYAGQLMPYHRYEPHPPLPAPHHMLPPVSHSHRLPSPPPPPSAYHPPPPQGWGGPSWGQHQGWEYPDRNVPYNTEDDWAARAKAWAAAKSVTDNHQTYSQFVPDGRIEEHTYAHHHQYQAAIGPPSDAQQSALSQSTNQQLPCYPLDQQKQANHLHGSAPLSSGLTSYDADMRVHYNSGDEVAPQKDHNSPAKNLGSTSSIYEQEVPYSYSSVPGNRDAVNQFPLPALSMQEGFVHPQTGLTDQNVGVDQPEFINGRQHSNYATDASSRALDFEPRPSELELRPNGGYGTDPSAGVVDHDAIAMSVNAWGPPTTPGVFPQVSVTESVTQPTLGPHTSAVYGRLPGPNFRPSVPPANSSFSLVSGASLNQATLLSADGSSPFTLSERPKKAAVPNWLREEIIKNKSVIATTYGGHLSGNSYNSTGSDEDDKLNKKFDLADNKSVASTKSTDDEEEEEDDAEVAKLAAINREIKRVLTEVLLKVTDELFDEIATRVLNEDDLTDEASDHKDLGNHKVSTPKASAKVLVMVKETMTDNGVNGGSTIHSPEGDLLGLGSYASDEEDDDVSTQNSKLLLVRGSNGSSSGNALKHVENENMLIDKGGPVRGQDGDASERAESNDALKNSNVRIHAENCASLDASHNHEKEQKDLSDTSSQHLLSRKNGMTSKISSNDHSASQSKGKTAGKIDMKRDHSISNRRSREPVSTEDPVRESKNTSSSNRRSERSYNKDSVKKELTVAVKSNSEASDETVDHENKIRDKENINKKNSSEISDDRNIKRGVNAKDSDSRSRSIIKDKIGILKDKKERDKEDTERKKEKLRDEREDDSRRVAKDSKIYSRRSPSPSHRTRSSKEKSSHGYGSVLNDEFSEVSKKRRLQSRSPSPTRSRTRQVSRSPHRKHSHHRHSPYSSDRRRSRSVSPAHRRR